MDDKGQYTQLAYQTSGRVANSYSTSFSAAITLLDRPKRAHIYAIYGLVRLADEVVDTWRPENAKELLDKLEHEVYMAIEDGFSTNIIVHSFAQTANGYGFELGLIRAFFDSMAMDIGKTSYTAKQYQDYIYGSAEVVGLMSLHVFCGKDNKEYQQLMPAARALGAAYQKINFLRDLAADYQSLGRMYFPDVDFDEFGVDEKNHICDDIKNDLRVARRGMLNLPHSSRYGVLLSLYYYETLLKHLQHSSPQSIKTSRLRISNFHKFGLYIMARVQKLFRI